MEKILKSHLFAASKDLQRVTGLSERAICQQALGTNRFLPDLRKRKCGFNIRTYDTLIVWMRETRSQYPYDKKTPEVLKPDFSLSG